jgi:hypothetical protein
MINLEIYTDNPIKTNLKKLVRANIDPRIGPISPDTNIATIKFKSSTISDKLNERLVYEFFFLFTDASVLDEQLCRDMGIKRTGVRRLNGHKVI